MAFHIQWIENFTEDILLESSWSLKWLRSKAFEFLYIPRACPEGYTRMRRLCLVTIEGTKSFPLYTLNFASEYEKHREIREKAKFVFPGGSKIVGSIFRKYFGFFYISLGQYKLFSLYFSEMIHISLIQKILHEMNIAK